MSTKPAVIALYMLLCPLCSWAQKNQDFRLWTEVKTEFDIGKKLEIQAQQEARFRNNASQTEKTLTQAGINYKPNDWFRFNPAVRHTVEGNNTWWRYQVDNTFSINLPDKFWWDHRIRVQYNREDPWEPNDFRFRYRTTVLKKINKNLSVYTEPELFYKHFFDYKNFYQYRLEGGIEFDILKVAEGSVFYIYEEEFNNEAPLQSHIVGLSLAFDFF